jgi:hypothetical protein
MSGGGGGMLLPARLLRLDPICGFTGSLTHTLSQLAVSHAIPAAAT